MVDNFIGTLNYQILSTDKAAVSIKVTLDK
jgi:uncharacterized protein with von Willebrand factor type A (vWA) domain